MTDDRRIVDSVGDEALVDAVTNALQVQLAAGAAAIGSVTVTALPPGVLAGMATLPAGANNIGQVEITDGVDVLDLFTTGDAVWGLHGPLIYGYRWAGANTALAMPAAYYSDGKVAKGNAVIPVTPMTGGREEGTFTRGFIPEHPVNDNAQGVAVANTTWVTVTTYTVTAGRTLWITDWIINEATEAAGGEFLGRLRIAGAVVMVKRAAAGHDIQDHQHTPVKATAGQVVDVQAHQWSGGALNFDANIKGFETVDTELD